MVALTLSAKGLALLRLLLALESRVLTQGLCATLLMALMLLAQLLPEGIPSLVLALKSLTEALLLLMMVLEYHGMASEQNSRR